MRVVVIVSLSLALVQSAEADPWKTTVDVALVKKPGARGRPLAKLKAGTEVVIEREEGKWVRVRVGKRVGYLARKAIADAAPAPADATPEEPPAEARPVDPAIAHRKTTIEVVLRKKPGERQVAVVKLPVGTPVVITTEEGRWYRVRAGKHEGYLPRTTVEEPVGGVETPVETTPAAPDAPPQERWSTERTSAKSHSTGLVVGVTAATAELRAEAEPTAPAIGKAKRGDRLAVVETTPGWVRVRTADGADAWITRADVDDANAGVAVTGSLDVSGPGTTAPSRRQAPTILRAGVAVGYRSIGMDFSSNGSAGLSNYLISADAAAADLEVDASTRIARLRIGVDGRIQVGTSSPGDGIEYPGPSLAGGKIAFGTFAADGGIRAGKRVRVFELAARAGFHYDAFVSKEVKNAGHLPRENLYGPTIGARIGIMPPASRVDVELRTDVLVLGRRGQTAGLEDGTDSTARAIWAGATIRIGLGRHLALVSAYEFGRATTEWTGMSIRDPSATEARRVDSNQTVRIGLAAER